MNKTIQSSFDHLVGHLTTDKQKAAYKNLLSVVHSAINQLEQKVERLSANTLPAPDGKVPVTVCEAVSNVARITVVPNERTTLKIPSNITSEKIRSDYICIAEAARDNYAGQGTIRGAIRWNAEENCYSVGFQTTKGRKRKTFGMKFDGTGVLMTEQIGE